MNSTPSQPDQDDDHLIVLPANGATVAAEELKVRLVLAADLDHETRIDASQVDNVGQAVLQLLVAARAEAERAGQPFAITDPSTAFADRVHGCRLGDALGLEIEKDQVQ